MNAAVKMVWRACRGHIVVLTGMNAMSTASTLLLRSIGDDPMETYTPFTFFPILGCFIVPFIPGIYLGEAISQYTGFTALCKAKEAKEWKEFNESRGKSGGCGGTGIPQITLW